MAISENDFTKIKNDGNGNPRYVCSFYCLLSEEEKNWNLSQRSKYQYAVKRANKIYGGRRYNTKSFMDSIVFQSYNIQDLCNKINEEISKF